MMNKALDFVSNNTGADPTTQDAQYAAAAVAGAATDKAKEIKEDRA